MSVPMVHYPVDRVFDLAKFPYYQYSKIAQKAIEIIFAGALAISAYAAISLLSMPFAASTLALTLTSAGIAIILLIASRAFRQMPTLLIKKPLRHDVINSARIPFELQNGDTFHISKGFELDICRKFVKLSINDVYLPAEKLQYDTEENRNIIIAEVLERIYAITKDKAKTERIIAFLDQGLAGELLSQFVEQQPFKKIDDQESPFWLQTVDFLHEARVAIHNGEEKIYAKTETHPAYYHAKNYEVVKNLKVVAEIVCDLKKEEMVLSYTIHDLKASR